MAGAINGVNGFTDLVDLVSERFGGRALLANDDFFAYKDNLVKPGRAVFIADKFTDHGKWMDGWESRRRRVPGNDWCVLSLGRPGAIRGVNVDTSHFKGNQPEAFTLDAAHVPVGVESDWEAQSWTQVVPRTALKPDSEHLVAATPPAGDPAFTHVRLNIFPDGGVARLRVYGLVRPDWPALCAAGSPVDLAAAENGAAVIACNDMHFGSRHNLIMPGRAVNMGDGWETRRKRGPAVWTGGPGGYDWCVVQLGRRARISRIEVDTNHFKGNFPDTCQIDVCDHQGTQPLDADRAIWRPILARTKLKADHRHFFECELVAEAVSTAFTHARLCIFPDGGVSRLRLWGTPEPQ